MPAATARIAATLQRDNVIGFKPPGTAAFPAPVAVALQDGSTYSSPAASIKVSVVSAHALFCDTIPLKSTFSIVKSPMPALVLWSICTVLSRPSHSLPILMVALNASFSLRCKFRNETD